ncbi:hypothetical protein [Tropicimonas sp. S265A]|uniref:hypothetical protein n=1 Tax=Tropicimonas sp. S265A TaxID=3415134 RepID=UPI003C7C1364
MFKLFFVAVAAKLCFASPVFANGCAGLIRDVAEAQIGPAHMVVRDSLAYRMDCGNGLSLASFQPEGTRVWPLWWTREDGQNFSIVLTGSGTVIALPADRLKPVGEGVFLQAADLQAQALCIGPECPSTRQVTSDLGGLRGFSDDTILRRVEEGASSLCLSVARDGSGTADSSQICLEPATDRYAAILDGSAVRLHLPDAAPMHGTRAMAVRSARRLVARVEAEERAKSDPHVASRDFSRALLGSIRPETEPLRKLGTALLAYDGRCAQRPSADPELLAVLDPFLGAPAPRVETRTRSLARLQEGMPTQATMAAAATIAAQQTDASPPTAEAVEDETASMVAAGRGASSMQHLTPIVAWTPGGQRAVRHLEMDVACDRERRPVVALRTQVHHPTLDMTFSFEARRVGEAYGEDIGTHYTYSAEHVQTVSLFAGYGFDLKTAAEVRFWHALLTDYTLQFHAFPDRMNAQTRERLAMQVAALLLESVADYHAQLEPWTRPVPEVVFE